MAGQSQLKKGKCKGKAAVKLERYGKQRAGDKVCKETNGRLAVEWGEEQGFVRVIYEKVEHAVEVCVQKSVK